MIVEQLAEHDPTSDLPPTLNDLVPLVNDVERSAQALEPAPVTTPGRFVEPLFFLDDRAAENSSTS